MRLALVRRLSIVVFSFSMSSQLNSQSLQDISNVGTNIGAVAVDGGLGVFNEGTKLRVMSIPSLSEPVIRGNLELGFVPICLQLRGDYAYTAEETGRFSIVDVSNPNSPTLAGSLDWDDWKAAVWVRKANDYAYVAGCSGGIKVIDVRIKSNPVILMSLPLSSCAYSITGDGGYLYVAHSKGNNLLSIYSLANPGSPVLIGSGPGSVANAVHMHNALAVFGDTAYSIRFGSLDIIDISDRSAPTLKSYLSAASGQVALATSNGMLYASNWNNTNSYQLAVPNSPVKLQEILGITGNEVTQSAASGNFSYSARSHSLWLTDVDARTNTLLRSITPGFGSARALARKDNIVFVGTGPGITAVDVSNSQNPVSIGQIASRWTTKIAVAGNYLYNISAWGYLEVYDISNPAAMSKMPSEFGLPGSDLSRCHVSADGSLVASISDKYLIVHSIGSNGQITHRSTSNLNSKGRAVAIKNSIIYVTDLNGDLTVYNCANPSQPQLINTISVFSGAITDTVDTACLVRGNRLHLAFSRRGYAVFDISSPGNPSFMGKRQLADIDVTGIAANNDTVFLATWGWNGKLGLRILDISDSFDPIQVVSRTATNFVADVDCDGDKVYYAEESGGLRIRQYFQSSAIRDWMIFN